MPKIVQRFCLVADQAGLLRDRPGLRGKFCKGFVTGS